jgi:hypothetical protein
MNPAVQRTPHDTESAEPDLRTLRPVMDTLRRGKFGISVNHGVSGYGVGLSRLRIKVRRQYKHCTGGWPANFERLRETKDLAAPCPHVIPRIPSFQDLQETFLEGSAKFGSRRLRNYHANHAIFRRVMIHLMAHMAHNGTYSPAGLAYRGLQNNHHPPEDTAIFPRRGILSDLGAFLGGPLARRDHQEQMNRQLPWNVCGNQK